MSALMYDESSTQLYISADEYRRLGLGPRPRRSSLPSRPPVRRADRPESFDDLEETVDLDQRPKSSPTKVVSYEPPMLAFTASPAPATNPAPNALTPNALAPNALPWSDLARRVRDWLEAARSAVHNLASLPPAAPLDAPLSYSPVVGPDSNVPRWFSLDL